MKTLVVFALTLMVWSDQTYAQTTGTCSPALGEAYLDVGNVRARILNNGNLFWRGSPDVYEVPKGEGIGALFAAGLWVGGFVEDSLRIAAAHYGNYEFWAGPLDTLGRPPIDCEVYDQVAILYRDDVERYERLGYVSDRLRAWPWQWGAPAVDGDGDPDNYNLAGGDRPELLGDQMLWWVMNDRGNAHQSTGSRPLGLEVQASAFALNRQGAVGNTTFYRYQLHYKGEAPLDSAYVALFVDADLGEQGDDYMGTDTTLGMGYVYNADNDDEGFYGSAPPALGVSFLRGPIVSTDGVDNDRDGTADEADEQLRASSITVFYTSGNVQGDPERGIEYYRYMQARWKDGKPFAFGGDGRNFSREPTPFPFPGDPVTRSYWSEINADNQGNPNGPGDLRFVVSSGPFRMEPGDIEDVVFAIGWSRGVDHLDSVRKLREDMAYIQSITPLLLEPRRAVANEVLEQRPVLGYHRNYPNPFTHQTTIHYSLERREHVTLTVYDMVGRSLATLVDSKQDAGWHEVIFDAEGSAPGVFVYRIQVGLTVATQTMVLVR